MLSFATNEVITCSTQDVDANLVRQSFLAVFVRPDAVTRNNVPFRPFALDLHAALRVSRDCISFPSLFATNVVTTCPTQDVDANLVRQSFLAVFVRPDVVTLENVPCRPFAHDLHAALSVPRDYVSFPGLFATNLVITCTTQDVGANTVRQNFLAVFVRPDVVSCDLISFCSLARDFYAAQLVSRDYVSFTIFLATNEVFRGFVPDHNASFVR